MNLVCCEQCGFPATVRIESNGTRRYACAEPAHQESAWAQVRQERGDLDALGDVVVRHERSGFPLVASSRRTG